MDHEKVMDFLGRFVTELGAAGTAGAIAIGNRLGLYRALAEGPATAEEFAERTGCHPRYITEWLRGQAAAGYVTYAPATAEFSLTDEQAFCLADPNGPNLAAACLTVLGYLRAEPQLAMVAYSPLLNGSYVRQDKPLDAEFDHPGTPARLAVLREVAKEADATVNQVVLAWLIGAEVPMIPLVGASSVAQVDESLAAVDLELTAEQRARLDAAR